MRGSEASDTKVLISVGDGVVAMRGTSRGAILAQRPMASGAFDTGAAVGVEVGSAMAALFDSYFRHILSFLVFLAL